MLLSCGAPKQVAPAPFGAVPSPGQLAWQRQEMLMFFHFGPATFSGYDGENPSCGGEPWSEQLLLDHYAPAAIDADQWVRVARDCGFRGIIVTAKHHDGFCLWDNPVSTTDVANPACRNHTDVLAELRRACDRYGLSMGIYLSPWDRMIEAEGIPTEEYETRYKAALADLMARYAPVSEIWFDGNHAGSFDWPAMIRVVLEANPDCVIFSNGGPGCRWVGNEAGIAGETSWSTLDIAGRGLSPSVLPGDYGRYLAQGDEGAAAWCPAESDFSLQRVGDPNGWFHGPGDPRRSAGELLDLYYKTVGRNSLFLLNVPPSAGGVLDSADVEVLTQFARLRERVFERDLAEGATAVASREREGFGAQKLLDGDGDSYYAAPDGVTAVDIEITLPEPQTFNLVQLQEYIPLGQRVKSFVIQVRSDGRWEDWAEGTTVGYKRILVGPAVTADAVRIRITEALACPVLNGFGLYSDPRNPCR